MVTCLHVGPADKTRLWFRDEQQRNTLWFEVGTEVIGLKAFSRSSQTGTYAAWLWLCWVKRC